MPRIEPGTYPARSLDQTPTPTKEGDGLLIWFNVEISPGVTLQTWQTIVTKDGTVKTKAVDNLKTIFGWDGTDPLWFEGRDLRQVEFSVVVIDEPDQKDATKIYSKIQWMNPAGGGGPSAERPKTVDKATVATKFGSRLRALAGPQPMKPAAKSPPPAAKPAPPAAPAKPAEPVKTSTLAEAWDELCGAMAGKTDDEIQAAWYEGLEKLFPGKGNELTPEQWEVARQHFEDNVPF